MRCPSCGESCKKSAKFCSNCGAALRTVETEQTPAMVGPPARRAVVPFLISMVGVVGLLAVAILMSFIADAPGEIGSPVAGLFHTVGAVQLILGLGVLVSAIFLMLKAFDPRVLANAIVGLGLVSIAALLVILADGTFAVVFLAIPGLLVVAAGLLARRSAA